MTSVARRQNTVESFLKDTTGIKTLLEGIKGTLLCPNYMYVFTCTPEMRTLLYTGHFTRSPNALYTRHGQGQDPESKYGQDTVKVFSHEGDGENTEHLNSMDLNDVKRVETLLKDSPEIK